MKSYFTGIKTEMRKVSWSSKQELIGSTLVVLVFAIILGFILWVLDVQILSRFTELIY